MKQLEFTSYQAAKSWIANSVHKDAVIEQSLMNCPNRATKFTVKFTSNKEIKAAKYLEVFSNLTQENQHTHSFENLLMRLIARDISAVEAIDVYDLSPTTFRDGGWMVEVNINDLPQGVRFVPAGLEYLMLNNAETLANEEFDKFNRR